jgi:hypothetical protein
VGNSAHCPIKYTGRINVGTLNFLQPEVTVRVVFPEILPEVAVMVAGPAATAVARPLLLTVATNASDELQVTCVLIS